MPAIFPCDRICQNLHHNAFATRLSRTVAAARTRKATAELGVASWSRARRRQRPVQAGPGEGALDHPATGLHGEAALAGLRSDEFDADRRGACDACPGIGAIGVAQRDE